MSNYGSNKVATAVLIDVSRGMDMVSSNGERYFERSKRLVSRILLRKMFAYETDEVGIISFGPEGVNTVSDLRIPNWDMYEKVDELSIAKASEAGNWAKALIHAVNFLEEQCQGKKFKSRQIVVLSNFTWSSPLVHHRLEPLIDVANGSKLQVLVIGLDIKKESQTSNEVPAGFGELVEFVDKLDSGLMLSFEEIEDDVKYYAKKKRAARLTKSAMKIGSEISLPFKWMKVTNGDTRLKFEFPARKISMNPNGTTDDVVPSKKPKTDFSVQPDNPSTSLNDPTANSQSFDLKFAQDESRKTRFGATEVLLSYADIEALKIKTGPPSMTFLGTVKSSRISRAMIMSPMVYIIVSDGSKRSQAQLSALVTALLNANKYGLARRIASINGRPKLGILYPVSDELGKALFFLQLPLADWINTVPFRPLPDVVEPDLDNMMNELIDAMSIDGRGKELLPKDPNFQLRNFRVELKARNSPDCDGVPELVQDILHPYPEKEAAGAAILKKVLSAFEIPPPPPPAGSESQTDKSGPGPKSITPKKELTEAEKKEIKAIEQMALENTEDMADEW